MVDLDRAVIFYGEVLGLPLIARPGPLAFFDMAGVRLFLEQGRGEGGGDVGGSVLYFTVPDIHAARAELGERGVIFESEPRVIFADVDGIFGPAGEEERMAFFRDSEGNLLGLSSRERPEG